MLGLRTVEQISGLLSHLSLGENRAGRRRFGGLVRWNGKQRSSAARPCSSEPTAGLQHRTSLLLGDWLALQGHDCSLHGAYRLCLDDRRDSGHLRLLLGSPGHTTLFQSFIGRCRAASARWLMGTDEESTANEATFVAVVMTLVLPTAHHAFIVILTEALVVVLALGLVTHTDLHDRGRHGRWLLHEGINALVRGCHDEGRWTAWLGSAWYPTLLLLLRRIGRFAWIGD